MLVFYWMPKETSFSYVTRRDIVPWNTSNEVGDGDHGSPSSKSCYTLATDTALQVPWPISRTLWANGLHLARLVLCTLRTVHVDAPLIRSWNRE